MSKKIAKTTGYNPTYHDGQFVSPYESTISFCDWLVELGVIENNRSSNISDLGCGKGLSNEKQ
jgi:hypothetical protein